MRAHILGITFACVLPTCQQAPVAELGAAASERPKSTKPPTTPAESKRQRLQTAQHISDAVGKDAAGRLEAECRSGRAESCTDLGALVQEGKGVAKDPARAVALYKLGCQGKNALGCANLATWYYVGGDIPKDIPEALRLFAIACEGDDSQSCANLGVSLTNGEGIEKNLPRATALFEKACHLGSQEGCFNAGLMHQFALGVEREPAVARRWFQAGCALGDAEACRAAEHPPRSLNPGWVPASP